MQTETTQKTRETMNEEASTMVDVGVGHTPVQRASTPTREGLLADGPMSSRSVASTGLAQMFGLDIRAAMLAILVDLMIFGSDILSVGLLIPFAMCVAAVLGVITYKIQVRWYGDDHNSALIKSLIVGLLTAIPAPLTPLIAIPSGILGIVKVLKRKSRAA